MPEEARDTLVALFPVKQSAIKKGGDAWTVPCRALIRAQASPPPSPKQQRKSARITMGARSEESSGNSSDSCHLDEPEPQKKKASDGAFAKSGGKEGSPPYLPSHALLAVLPPQRRAQLYLAEMWSTQTKAEREKHLERINSRQEGFGPGPGACHSELVPGELRSRAGRRLPRTRARRASVPGRAPDPFPPTLGRPTQFPLTRAYLHLAGRHRGVRGLPATGRLHSPSVCVPGPRGH